MWIHVSSTIIGFNKTIGTNSQEAAYINDIYEQIYAVSEPLN